MFITLTQVGTHLQGGSQPVTVRIDAIMFISPNASGSRVHVAPGVWLDVEESSLQIGTQAREERY